jgi:hypothetical protein
MAGTKSHRRMVTINGNKTPVLHPHTTIEHILAFHNKPVHRQRPSEEDETDFDHDGVKVERAHMSTSQSQGVDSIRRSSRADTIYSIKSQESVPSMTRSQSESSIQSTGTRDTEESFVYLNDTAETQRQSRPSRIAESIHQKFAQLNMSRRGEQPQQRRSKSLSSAYSHLAEADRSSSSQFLGGSLADVQESGDRPGEFVRSSHHRRSNATAFKLHPLIRAQSGSSSSASSSIPIPPQKGQRWN